jgi:hypothetical protein
LKLTAQQREARKCKSLAQYLDTQLELKTHRYALDARFGRQIFHFGNIKARRLFKEEPLVVIWDGTERVQGTENAANKVSPFYAEYTFNFASLI